MLRQAVSSGRVTLEKVHTSLNKADIFTKALTGEDFKRCRALVMGLEYELPPDDEHISK